MRVDVPSFKVSPQVPQAQETFFENYIFQSESIWSLISSVKNAEAAEILC